MQTSYETSTLPDSAPPNKGDKGGKKGDGKKKGSKKASKKKVAPGGLIYSADANADAHYACVGSGLDAKKKKKGKR